MTLYQYNGSGLIIKSSTIDEKKSYNYNLNSSSDNTDDYQLITNNFTLSDDYGSVNQSSGQVVDYNIISESVSEITLPFGRLTFSGSAITEPNYRVYLSGQAQTKVIYSPDNTSGVLFGFGQKLERRSHAYNLSSIFDNEDDYGSVTSISGLLDDYGLITQSGLLLEYGLITENISGVVLPFGKLTLSGSAITQPNYRLYFSGSALEKFVHHPNNLTGTLFGFGQKIESITFDYNESSTSENILDYGLIANVVNEINDYENILGSLGSSAFDNYGLITDPNPSEPITYPFGSLFISGSVSNIQLRNSEVGVGTITIGGELVPPNIDFTPSLNLSGTIHISGTSRESTRNEYVASGSLFGFGEKIEKVTYDYNEESITVNSLDDFGSVSGVSTEFYDYGLITSIIDEGIDNYGRVSSTPFASTPFGTITLSGSLIEGFDEGPYTTTGSIFIFSGNAYVESFTADTPDNTQLFQISGSALTSDIDSYIGIGTLLKFGEKLESVTYDYNESSIVNSEDDYGLITNLDTQFSDYGSITGQGSGQLDDDYGLISQVVTSISGYPFGSLVISGTVLEKDVDSYVGLGTIFISAGSSDILESDSYSGFGTATLSGSAIEKDVDSYVGSGSIFMDVVGVTTSSLIARTISYVGLGTLTLSGTALESFSAQTPEDTQLFLISGTITEKETDSYVGLGTVTLSASLVERDVESYVGLGTLTLSGTVLESFSAQTPEDTQLFTISGTALESFSAQTPEDTQLFVISGTITEKETDSYVGLGTLTLSASLVEKDTESYVGVGTLTLSGVVNDSAQRTSRGVGSIFIVNGYSPQESYPWLPEPGVGRSWSFTRTTYIAQPVSLNISSGIALTHYYSPIYPRNSGIPGSGIGTIRLNDDNGLTITRAVLPYFARGTLVLSGVGAESFSITNYNGSGLVNISGISSNREIAVYQDYVTGGVITISQQTSPIIVLKTNSYVGFGTVTLSASVVEKDAESYNGSGSITLSGTTLESFSAQTPENTQLFTISGSSLESYSAQTPETEVLYQLSGTISERRTFGYSGSGQITLSNAALSAYVPRVSSTLLFKFVTHLSDNLYDTCDSLDVTCDYEHSASFRLVSNPQENTILFNISGSAITKEIAVYIYNGSGTVGISGSFILRKTKSFVGIGTLTISSISTKSTRHSYIGFGSITVLSGAAESHSTKPPTSTTLFVFSESAFTRTLRVKRYAGIGTAYFSGSASTKKFSRSSYSGIGTIFLSGELVYPNIKYIPAPKGVGLISINGSGLEKVGRKYLPVIQPLFFFSGGFESFSETPYVGVGTIYIQSTSASTINNPYQIPRVYVTII